MGLGQSIVQKYDIESMRFQKKVQRVADVWCLYSSEKICGCLEVEAFVGSVGLAFFFPSLRCSLVYVLWPLHQSSFFILARQVLVILLFLVMR